MHNDRGNSGWDNCTAADVQVGDKISAVKSTGAGAWQGVVEFIDTQATKRRFRFADGKMSAWYTDGGTLARYY